MTRTAVRTIVIKGLYSPLLCARPGPRSAQQPSPWPPESGGVAGKGTWMQGSESTWARWGSCLASPGGPRNKDAPGTKGWKCAVCVNTHWPFWRPWPAGKERTEGPSEVVLLPLPLGLVPGSHFILMCTVVTSVSASPEFIKLWRAGAHLTGV